jgi:hypothetical protein
MRSLLAGILVVVALAVAGCGGGTPSNGEAKKPAEEVLADAAKAVAAAKSLRMSGSVNARGNPIRLDISAAKGKGTKGSIRLGGNDVQLIIIGNDGYMKAPASFWSSLGVKGKSLAQLGAGRWLKFPADSPQFQPIVAFSDPTALFEQLKKSSGSLTNSGATTYKGQKVVALDYNAQNETLYVAATGKPLPVALTNWLSGNALDFSDWNKPVALVPPKNVVDASSLG